MPAISRMAFTEAREPEEYNELHDNTFGKTHSKFVRYSLLNLKSLLSFGSLRLPFSGGGGAQGLSARGMR